MQIRFPVGAGNDGTDDICSAIRGTVVNYKYVKVTGEGKHRLDYIGNVLLFVVCGDYD